MADDASCDDDNELHELLTCLASANRPYAAAAVSTSAATPPASPSTHNPLLHILSSSSSALSASTRISLASALVASLDDTSSSSSLQQRRLARVHFAHASLDLLMESASEGVLGDDVVPPSQTKEHQQHSSPTLSSTKDEQHQQLHAHMSTHVPVAWRAIRITARELVDAVDALVTEQEQTACSRSVDAAKLWSHMLVDAERRDAADAAAAAANEDKVVEHVEHVLRLCGKKPHRILAECAWPCAKTTRARRRLAAACLRPGCEQTLRMASRAAWSSSTSEDDATSTPDQTDSTLARLLASATTEQQQEYDEDDYMSHRWDAFSKSLLPLAHAVVRACAAASKETNTTPDGAVSAATETLSHLLGDARHSVAPLLGLILWDTPQITPTAEWRLACARHLFTSLPSTSSSSSSSSSSPPIHVAARRCRMHARLASALPDTVMPAALSSLGAGAAPLGVLRDAAEQHGELTTAALAAWEEALRGEAAGANNSSRHAHSVCSLALALTLFADACVALLTNGPAEDALNVAKTAAAVATNLEDEYLQSMAAWLALVLLEVFGTLYASHGLDDGATSGGGVGADVGADAVLDFVEIAATVGTTTPRSSDDNSNSNADEATRACWDAQRRLLEEHRWRLRALVNAAAGNMLPAREAAALLAAPPARLVAMLGDLSAYAAGEAAARRHGLSPAAAASLARRREAISAAEALARSADRGENLPESVDMDGAASAFEAAMMLCETPEGAARLLALASHVESAPEAPTAAACRARLGGTRTGGLAPRHAFLAPAYDEAGRNVSWPHLDRPGRSRALGTLYECMAAASAERRTDSFARGTKDPRSSATRYIAGTLHNLTKSALATELPNAVQGGASVATILRSAGVLPPLLTAADGGLGGAASPSLAPQKPHLARLLRYVASLGDAACTLDAVDASSSVLDDNYLGVLTTSPREILARVVLNGGGHSDALQVAELLGCSAHDALIAAIAPRVAPPLQPHFASSSAPPFSESTKLSLLEQMSELSPRRSCLAAVLGVAMASGVDAGTREAAWAFAEKSARQAISAGRGGQALLRWVEMQRAVCNTIQASASTFPWEAPNDVYVDADLARNVSAAIAPPGTLGDDSDGTKSTWRRFAALAAAAKFEDHALRGGASAQTLQRAMEAYVKMAEDDPISACGEEGGDLGGVITVVGASVPMEEVAGWLTRLLAHDAPAACALVLALPEVSAKWRDTKRAMCASVLASLGEDEPGLRIARACAVGTNLDSIVRCITHFAESGSCMAVAGALSDTARVIGTDAASQTALQAAAADGLSLNTRLFILESARSVTTSESIESARACMEFARRLPAGWISTWPPTVLVNPVMVFEMLLRECRVKTARRFLALHPSLTGTSADEVVARLAVASILPPRTVDGGGTNNNEIDFTYPNSPSPSLMRVLLSCCSTEEAAAAAASSAGHRVATLRLAHRGDRGCEGSIEEKFKSAQAVVHALTEARKHRARLTPAGTDDDVRYDNEVSTADDLLMRRCELLLTIYASWRDPFDPRIGDGDHADSQFITIPDLHDMSAPSAVDSLAERLQSCELYALSVFVTKQALALLKKDGIDTSDAGNVVDTVTRRQLQWYFSMASSDLAEATRRVRACLSARRDTLALKHGTAAAIPLIADTVLKAALRLQEVAKARITESDLRARLRAVMKSAEAPAPDGRNGSMSRRGYLHHLVVPQASNTPDAPADHPDLDDPFELAAAMVRDLAPTRAAEFYQASSRAASFLELYIPLPDDERDSYGTLDSIVALWCAGTNSPVRRTLCPAALRELIWALETRAADDRGVPRLSRARARRDMALAATSLVLHHGGWADVLALAVASGAVAAAGLAAAVLAVDPGVASTDALALLDDASAHLDGAIAAGDAPLPAYAAWPCALVLGSSARGAAAKRELYSGADVSALLQKDERLDASVLARLATRVRAQREAVTVLKSADVSEVSLFGWRSEDKKRRLRVASRVLIAGVGKKGSKKATSRHHAVDAVTLSLRIATEFIGPSGFGQVVELAVSELSEAGDNDRVAMVREVAGGLTVM